MSRPHGSVATADAMRPFRTTQGSQRRARVRAESAQDRRA